MRLNGGRRLAIVASALVLAAVAAPAGAATFGANLGNAPNSTATCGEGVFPYFSAPMGSPSCMYFSGAPGPSPYAPSSGTITAIHVRVGAVTGPMQAVVLRSLYQNKEGDPGHPYYACCFVEHYGPVFTPQANAVTTVQTALSVTEEPTPAPDDFSTSAAGDFLALSVLAPNVPIPAFADGQSGYTGYYPAPSEGTTPAPSPNPLTAATDGFGAQILISADLDTGGGGGGAGGGGGGAPAQAPAPAPVPAPAPLPSIALPKLTIPVRNDAATVPVQCLLVDCRGVLSLQNAQPAGAARAASKKPKLLSYGAASFSLKAGTTGKVKVKLNAAGRKLMRAHKRAKVWANIRFTSGSGKARSTRLTLKR